MSNQAMEFILIVTMAVTVPTFVMAAWHGWKFEQHRANRLQDVPQEPGKKGDRP